MYLLKGKFQMQVLPQCGHAVHEDAPDKVSKVHSFPFKATPLIYSWYSNFKLFQTLQVRIKLKK